ncbi:MAG: alginate export family protein [Xanthomonadaceae bacterium]|nr:alginate export family protein [Xanthomonadaceae bacterium]
MKMFQSNLLVAAMAALLAAPAWADAPAGAAAPATSQVAPLQLVWNARLRDESVDDAAFARDARADTLRLRLGVQARFSDHWSGMLEGVGLASAGDRYNSGANRQTQYPGITDPRGSQLNQAWLHFQGGQFGATVGRQELVLDNHRWVGNVGWRQFEQTYDGISLKWKPAAGWTVNYAWLDRVHRVSGPDAVNPLLRERRLDTNLLNLAYVHGAQTWVGYAYLHKDRDVPGASTATYGVRWLGSYVEQGSGPGWTAEYARQSDYAGNPASYGADYWLLEPSWTQRGLTAKLGWEHLGGDGRHAVQTPLATLHAFNGWDDQFLVTPAGGLDDRYLNLGGKLGRSGFAGKLGWVVGYHDFHADRGGRYGSEWDASLAFPVVAGIQGLLKLADYRADGFGHDDTKLWLQFEWHGRQAL